MLFKALESHYTTTYIENYTNTECVITFVD